MNNHCGLLGLIFVIHFIKKVPFLSVGEDLGNRVVLHEGNSALSGDYVVEDVDGDAGHKYRRLIFLDNKNGVTIRSQIDNK